MPVARIFPLASILALAAATEAQTFSEAGTTVLNASGLAIQSVSFADVDNDGDPDLLLQGNSNSRRFYLNKFIETGTLKFEFAEGSYGIVASDTHGWSSAWADYDGDGDVDVFLGEANTGSARGDLFRNNLMERIENPELPPFQDVSSSTINDPGFHQCVAWCDIDNDLDLDLVIAMEGPERHEIYLQQSDGSFTAVGAAANFQQNYGTKAYGMAIGDADGDGDQDVYISTCIGGANIRNNFYDNQLTSGTLTFVDLADTNGTQFMDNSYGTEFHDFDDDGDLDLFMCGADGYKSKIWRNDGNGIWTDIDDVTEKPLLSDTGGDFNGGHPVDYDNDGDLDLFFHDHLLSSRARYLYRNDGDWTFTNVTVAEGLDASGEEGYDSSWADVDLDGDLDLVTSSGSQFPERVFLSNASTNGNHWLFVRLRANAPNTRGIGTRLYATINKGTENERTLRRDANTNAGTFAQNDLPVHFGLGDAEVIDELRVVWPDGSEITYDAVAVDQYLTLTQTSHHGWTVR